MKDRGLIKYLGIIMVGSILLSCGMGLRAEEKEAEKVEIEVPQDEYWTTKEKYLVTREERDRIFRMRDAVNETLGAIEEAYRNREIDLDTKLICKVKALEEPGGVPEKYKSIKYGKEKPELKYHQDEVKRVVRDVHENWLKTRIETHSKLWSSEIFPHLKEYIKRAAERERDMFGYEYLYISPDDAYIIREIDLDQLFLYRYGPPEERPAGFIPPKRTRIPEGYRSPDMVIIDLTFLPRYSKYLKPETREKIKLHRWKDLAERRGNRVGIGIDSPEEAVGGFSWGIGYPEKEKQGGAKVYTPRVKIKGKIVTPEMFGEVEAWAALRGDGRLSFPVEESREVREVRKEINLGPARYEKPLFDEKRFKESLEKWTERGEGGKVEVDEEFVMDYERGPGKIIRPFEIELELPYYIGNIITIGAQNKGGESTSIELYVTRYDSTDKEPPKVKIKDPKDGVVLGTLGVYVRKDEIMKKEEILLPVYCEATDNRKILKVAVYLNEKLGGEDFRTDQIHIGYDKNGNSIWADYYRVDVPVEIGKNKIKAIAYDIGGNSKSDSIEVIYSPEKR